MTRRLDDARLREILRRHGAAEDFDALLAEREAAERERDALARELAEREGWTGYHERLIREREAAVNALAKARAYVEEPGAPGTVIETTEESAQRSAVLLAEIDAALAAAVSVTGRTGA